MRVQRGVGRSAMAGWPTVESAIRRSVASLRDRCSGDRGDVPGWVMIAVMTAALVVAIMVPFRSTIIPAMTGAIQDMFGQAE